MPDSITPWELSRRLDKIEERAATREGHEALKERVEALEERETARSRMVMAGLIMPVVASVLGAVLVYLIVRGHP